MSLIRQLLATIAVILFAAGCGGGGASDGYGAPAGTGGATGTSGAAGTSGTTSAAAGGEGTVVNVGETDFALQLSQTSFSPGTYTFVAQNNGKATHSLEVEGLGIEKKTSNLAPGGSERLTVTLQKGKYLLYCPVGNHKALGMQVEINVG